MRKSDLGIHSRLKLALYEADVCDTLQKAAPDILRATGPGLFLCHWNHRTVARRPSCLLKLLKLEEAYFVFFQQSLHQKAPAGNPRGNV